MNNKRTNRLIQLLIIAGDFAVLWVLLYYMVDAIPRSEGWDEEKGRAFWMVCTFAFVVAEYLFSSIIHERVVGANDILRRSTKLVATQTLLSYLLLRAIRFLSRLGWQLFAMGFVMLVCIILLRFIERWLVKKLRQYRRATSVLERAGWQYEHRRAAASHVGTYGTVRQTDRQVYGAPLRQARYHWLGSGNWLPW